MTAGRWPSSTARPAAIIRRGRLTSGDPPGGATLTDPITVTPIGVVSGGRTEIFEDRWGPVVSRLILDPAAVDADATLGLGEFSHIEVVFYFHLESRTRRGAAHPRGNPAWPRVGVLAGHSPIRPNHLGVSRCELLSVDGLTLTVRGLDAIHGTPILDIKPYATEFDPKGQVRQPAWMRELMREYY
jgi:tRNA (adenine37-N6)-methyltransferase